MENKEKESLNWIERDIIESRARGQKIITRFPPEPNGFPHIGHASAAIVNFGFATKYDGYLNLRMDDTNPEKEDMKYVDAMVDAMEWLGIKYKNLFFASDYYEQLYDMAVGLVKKGLAYVDFQTAEQISATRGTLTTAGQDSPYRNTTPAENLKLLADMRAGKFPDGHCVLRAKIDMASGNVPMRDPVMYRIMREKHYRTGDKWCIYPMYDFAHCLSDAIEGISHSCCSLEFDNNRPLYDWYVEHAWTGKGRPRQFEFSRLNIEQTVMSKRYLKRFVDEGTVEGWDDPRMPTIGGMRRRGYPASAIIEFVRAMGLSRAPRTVPLNALEFYVRTHLDPVATRVAVVFDPIKIVITNYETGKTEKLPIANNPHDETAGTHEINFGREIYIDGEDFSVNPEKGWKRLSPGGTVRLRGAYIIKCDRVVTDKSGKITHLECSYYKDSKSGNDKSGIKPNGTIHFVESTTGVPITVNEYLPLLHSGTALAEENINKESKITHNAIAEPFIKTIKHGHPCQFVRKGFFALDKDTTFIKTVGLREGK
ncbi:MAG: glutamine--tRNA ligase [Firmicutes bacterium]|nr:glutamine--tRNA ligase [Bacillota bacterium]